MQRGTKYAAFFQLGVFTPLHFEYIEKFTVNGTTLPKIRPS